MKYNIKLKLWLSRIKRSLAAAIQAGANSIYFSIENLNMQLDLLKHLQ